MSDFGVGVASLQSITLNPASTTLIAKHPEILQDPSSCGFPPFLSSAPSQERRSTHGLGAPGLSLESSWVFVSEDVSKVKLCCNLNQGLITLLSTAHEPSPLN